MDWFNIIKGFTAYRDEIARLKEESDKITGTVKCPDCGSTDLRRTNLSGKNRHVEGLGGRVDSRRYGKHGQKGRLTCNTCGYVWST